MKKLSLLMLVLVSCIALAACGGNNAPNAPKDKQDAHGDHKDHDDHGKMSDPVKKKVGDKDVEAAFGDWHAGKEGVAEVNTGGKLADAPKFWAEQGGVETPHNAAAWVEGEKLYDCHVELVKLKAGKAKFFVEIGGKKESWDVDIK